jgi:hypothetical protein
VISTNEAVRNGSGVKVGVGTLVAVAVGGIGVGVDSARVGEAAWVGAGGVWVGPQALKRRIKVSRAINVRGMEFSFRG